MCIQITTSYYSDNLCQKLPGDKFPAEIWQITGTGFNWVQAHSQNFGFGNEDLVQLDCVDVTGSVPSIFVAADYRSEPSIVPCSIIILPPNFQKKSEILKIFDNNPTPKF